MRMYAKDLPVRGTICVICSFNGPNLDHKIIEENSSSDVKIKQENGPESIHWTFMILIWKGTRKPPENKFPCVLPSRREIRHSPILFIWLLWNTDHITSVMDLGRRKAEDERRATDQHDGPCPRVSGVCIMEHGWRSTADKWCDGSWDDRQWTKWWT